MSPPAIAQVIPDNTLGAEQSVLIDEGVVFGTFQTFVEGGAQLGTHLFHSFSEFSIAANERLLFSPTDGIQTIFARVTGDRLSTLDGILGVEGDADLFLLNPNGILFGDRARLDLQGSFVGTTADGVQFGDRGRFSALSPAAPSPLLTVQPSALLFSTPAPTAPDRLGLIQNRSVPRVGDEFFGLRVDPGKALLLVGREILIDGGGVFANAGRLELGGVADAGAIALNPDTYELTLPPQSVWADVTLVNDALVDMDNGGILRVHGRNLRIDREFDSEYFPIVLYSGVTPGQIDLNLQDRIEISGDRGVASIAEDGPGGEVNVRTRSLIVRDAGEISTTTAIDAPGGDLNIIATESVEVFGATPDNQPGIGAGTLADGAGGNLTITTPLLSIREGGVVSAGAVDGRGRAGDLTVNADRVEVVGTTFAGDLRFSLLRTETFGQGDSGDLTINAREVLVRDGGTITTRSFGAATDQQDSRGNGGALTINASESILVEGESSDDPFVTGQIISLTTTAGDAGSIELNTPRLLIRGGAFISSEADEGSRGRGGDVTVNASEFVEISGRAQRRSGTDDSIQFSQLSSRTRGGNRAGNIAVTTPALRLRDGGLITAATETAARGGDISLNGIEQLTVENGSQITAIATNPQGQAGTLSIEAQTIDLSNQSRLSVEATNGGTAGSLEVRMQRLNLQAGSQLSVSSPSGIAGSLEIGGDRVILDHSRLNAETGLDNPSGRGAEIALRDLGILLLRNGAQITASANDNAQGGNLNLIAQFIIAIPREDSDIRANAVRGQGGNVEIFSDRLFGIEPAERPLSISDITASSELGAPGTVALNTLDLDPSRGLAELPSNLIDGANQIDRSCSAETLASGSGFVITGRGGIPAGPEESSAGWTDRGTGATWIALPPAPTARAGSQVSVAEVNLTASRSVQSAIEEASGWRSQANGTIQLISAVPFRAKHSVCNSVS